MQISVLIYDLFTEPAPLGIKFADVESLQSVNVTWSPISSSYIPDGNLRFDNIKSECYPAAAHYSNSLSLYTMCSLLREMPHHVRSTTSLSLPLMLVPPTLEMVTVYPAQCSAPCYLLYLIFKCWSPPLILC